MDLNFLENFKLTTRSYKAIQKLRIQIGNAIYSFLIEQYLRKTSKYPLIKQLRRDKKKAKETRRLIENTLKEELGIDIRSKEFLEEFERAKKEDEDYLNIKRAEYQAKKRLEQYLSKIPIYREFLSKIRGINSGTASQLITYIEDINRFPSVSSLFQYCGLGDANCKPKKGEQLVYNPRLKSLLLGIIGRNLIMMNNEYKQYYEQRKEHTKKTHPEWSNLHRHNDARRVMVKKFLRELYKKWKELERS